MHIRCGENKKVRYESQVSRVTDVLTKLFWCPLCIIRVHTHGQMECIVLRIVCILVNLHKITNVLKIFVVMICVCRTLWVLLSFTCLWCNQLSSSNHKGRFTLLYNKNYCTLLIIQNDKEPHLILMAMYTAGRIEFACGLFCMNWGLSNSMYALNVKERKHFKLLRKKVP